MSGEATRRWSTTPHYFSAAMERDAVSAVVSPSANFLKMIYALIVFKSNTGSLHRRLNGQIQNVQAFARLVKLGKRINVLVRRL